MTDSTSKRRSMKQGVPPRGGTSFWRTGLGAGAGFALIAAGTIIPTTAANAAAGDPFDPNVPLAFVAQGVGATQLFRMVPEGTGYVFQDEGDIADLQYNALGFNSVDNYLYALAEPAEGSDERHLLRIGSEGVYVDLGPISGLESIDAGGYNQGAFGDGANAGTLFVRAMTADAIFAVDVENLTAERIALSSPVDNLSDFASRDGYLWGVGLNNDTMFRIDPATGEVSSWVMGLGLSSAYGAQFFLGNGNLALSQNSNGNVWQVEITDPTSATPTFSLAISQPIPGPRSTNNDGASILGQPVDLSVAKRATGAYVPGDGVTDTIDYSITVTNNGPGASSGAVVTDSLPEQILLNAQLQFPEDVCTLTGADLICTIPALAANDSFAIDISGEVSGTATGDITNTATVLGNEEDPNPGNNEDSATTVPTDVLPVPEATDDVSEGNEPGTPVTVDVLGKDDDTLIPDTVRVIDPETGEPATEVVVPGEGTWTVEDDGSITFTPEDGFTGDPTPIEYTAEDENGTPATATVTIDYVDPLPVPEATDDVSEGNEPGTPVTVDVLGNDDDTLIPDTVRVIDPETGEPATEVVVPGEGTWTVDNGLVTFTPEDGFTGDPTPIEYTAEDENGTPATATVTIDYVDPLPVPEATDDVSEGNEPGTPVTVDVLENDDEGLLPETVRLIDPETGEPATEVVVPGEGTWTVENGLVTFTPEDGFTGDPTPIEYTAEDADGNSATATVTITYVDSTPEEPAPAPQASDDSSYGNVPGTPVTVDVLANDDEGLLPETVRLIDPETGELVTELVVPGEGTWTVENGLVTFTPEDGFEGDPTPVDYSAENADGSTATATVTIGYEAVPEEPNPEEPNPEEPNPEEPNPEEPNPEEPNPEEPNPEEPAPSPAPEEPKPEEPAPSPAPEDPAATPQANDDVVTGATPGDSVNVRVLDNDDEGLLPESVRLIDPETGELVRELVVPGEGTWTVEDDGSITFTPEAGFTGDPTPVKYSAADENGNRTEATVTIDYLDLAAPASPGDSLSPTGGSIAVPLGVAGGALLLGGAVALGLRRRTQQ